MQIRKKMRYRSYGKKIIADFMGQLMSALWFVHSHELIRSNEQLAEIKIRGEQRKVVRRRVQSGGVCSCSNAFG